MVFSRLRSSLLQALATSLACFVIAGSSAGASLEDSEVISSARSIEALVNASDVSGLKKIHDKLLVLHRKAPGNESRYALAYCRYRLATLQMGKADNSAAGGLLKSAQEDLEQVLKDAPAESEENVEAMSLLAGVMGLRIGLEPGLGMSLGMRSGRLLAKAGRLSAENPRVLLQVGVSKFNTPKMFGGSFKKAEVVLRKAVSIFAGDRPSEEDTAPWPDWGYLDALAWLGQTLVAQDKGEEARAVYQQALAIEPNMGWIRYQLLPALDGELPEGGE